MQRRSQLADSVQGNNPRDNQQGQQQPIQQQQGQQPVQQQRGHGFLRMQGGYYGFIGGRSPLGNYNQNNPEEPSSDNSSIKSAL